nr:3-phosphoshikimate 1-carboxyvinyltransferase [Marinicella gelatinilytica]
MPDINPQDTFRLQSPLQLRGEIRVPGDKSISHRSMILAAISEGQSHVSGFLESEDCIATMQIMQALGVHIEALEDGYLVHGVGLHGLKEPDKDLDCGNAGTGMRLLSGLLAAQSFASTLVGDESLSVRPMKRIIEPLSQMGAMIASNDHTAPLRFTPAVALKGINYISPVASAQVKSAILLAGIYANGKTSVTEPLLSRDHTETMLQGFGCDVKRDGLTVTITPPDKLVAQNIQVPGDISSAAFFMVLGLLHPQADFVIEQVSINPTRSAVVEILQRMGGDIEVFNQSEQGGEPVACLRIKSSALRGIDIPRELIPSAIDEFPILFIAAALAKGTTRLSGAEELRHKESDRIHVMCQGLQILGINCQEQADGVIIHGGELTSGIVDGEGDHRCAMSFLVASALSNKAISVRGCQNINTSFPNFFQVLRDLDVSVQRPLPVIAVDGPSGVGKGTLCSQLAQSLGWHLLDSGAIYRALALQVINDDLVDADETTWVNAANQLDLRFVVTDNGNTEIYLADNNVTAQLRSEQCAKVASLVAPVAAVRQALLHRQQAFLKPPGLVADGRDMGTVVFKNAPLKLFLTASPTIRAERRHKQLQNSGVNVKIRDLLKDIEARDARDSSRRVAPLVPALDAITIDTGEMSIEQVFEYVMSLVNKTISQ